MKLALARSEFWRGIDAVTGVVPGKPAMPVLANVLLTADTDSLQLSATDLDMAIRVRVAAAVEVPGAITVPARMLADIVREWPDAELQLELIDHTLSLSGSLAAGETSEGAYKLAGLPADDFPAFPEDLGGIALSVQETPDLDAQTVGDMIQRTSFAVARDDTRPVLNGALWRLEPQGLLMLATDGHRFAHYRRRLDLSALVPEQHRDAIVPPSAMALIGKLLGAGPEELRLTFGDNQLMVDTGSTQVVTRLIEGPYVDFQQVIPRQNDRRLVVTTQHFLPAVRRVSVLASSYTHQIRLALKPGVVELSANSPEVGGDAREVVPVEYDDEPMDIGYNAQYLIEIMRRMGADSVAFELANHLTAAIIRPAAQDELQDFFCLLMPLRPTG